MDRNLQNIEDLFRDGLEDNEEIPSVQVWDAIDNSLDKVNIGPLSLRLLTVAVFE